jgi:hypothetical protein
MKPEVAEKMIKDAIQLAQTTLNNYGDRYGYAQGARAQDTDIQCMIYFGIMGAVIEHKAHAPANSAFANALNKAEKWAQKGINDWCKPRGGQMNAGLMMMMDAATDVNKGKANKVDWTDKLRELGAKLERKEPLTATETAVIAAIVVTVIVKEAVPVLP